MGALDHDPELIRQAADKVLSASDAELLAWLQLSPAHVKALLLLSEFDLASYDGSDPLRHDNSKAARLRMISELERIAYENADAIRIASAAAAVEKAEASNSLSSPPANVTKNCADNGVVPTPPPPPSQTPRRSTGSISFAWAAALLVFVSLLLLYAPNRGGEQSFTTGPGEWRTVDLLDGSIVQMAPRTRIDVRMESSRRRIELPRGEAMFDVAKDASRPFTVRTQLLEARAVGTRFAVRNWGHDDRVTVAEGVVAVTRIGSTPQGAAKIGVGDQAALEDSSRPLRIRRVDIPIALAWTERRLEFTGDATLAVAVEELNQRNHLQLRIDDPALAAQPIRGTYRATDPEGFVSYLQSVRPVTTIKEPSGTLRIVPRRAPSGHDARTPR